MNDPLYALLEKTTRHPHIHDMTCHATLSFKLFSWLVYLFVCLPKISKLLYEKPTFQPSHLTRSLSSFILFHFPKKQAVWRGISGASLCCPWCLAFIYFFLFIFFSAKLMWWWLVVSYILLLLFCFHSKNGTTETIKAVEFRASVVWKTAVSTGHISDQGKRRSLLVKMNEVEKFFFARIYFTFFGEKNLKLRFSRREIDERGDALESSVKCWCRHPS